MRRQALFVGLAGTAIAAVAMGVDLARHGQAWFFRNDAEFFWVVARDPFGRGELFRPVAAVTGNAYRFGRPLYPMLAWALALGRAGAVRWTMLAVELVAFGVTLALAAELLARRGAPVDRALTLLLVPGIWWSVVLAISEPLVLALVLLVYLFYLDGRRAGALVAAALLLLARESAGLALLPLALADARRRGLRSLGAWAATAVPLVGWWVWVRARVGEWPFLDRSESRRGALTWPVAGYLHRPPGGFTAAHGITFALAAATVVLAIWVWRRRPWFPVSQGALLFGLLLLVLGPNATRFPGEVLRLMVPAQVLIVLAVAGALRRVPTSTRLSPRRPLSSDPDATPPTRPSPRAAPHRASTGR